MTWHLPFTLNLRFAKTHKNEKTLYINQSVIVIFFGHFRHKRHEYILLPLEKNINPDPDTWYLDLDTDIPQPDPVILIWIYVKDLGFHTKTRFFSFKIRILFFYSDPDWAIIPVYGSFKNPDRKMYKNSAKYVSIDVWKKNACICAYLKLTCVDG